MVVLKQIKPTVEVAAPAVVSAASVAVAITRSGEPAYSVNFNFEYTASTTVQSIHPRTGPTTGLTPVTVMVTRFLEVSSHTDVACTFGSNAGLM